MMTNSAMLEIAMEEARTGLAEGGIPIGAAIFRADGTLISRGHNRRVQQDDPSSTGRRTRSDARDGSAATAT